jgi:hypothetical protein
MTFVTLQQEGSPFYIPLIGALISYPLAIGIAALLTRLIDERKRSNAASLSILSATLIISLPALFDYLGLNISRLAVQGWSILPLAMYHALTAIQMRPLYDTAAQALGLYLISGIVGIGIGIAFPQLNNFIPLIIVLVLCFNKQANSEA